jgi:uncharacterized membrane protein
MSGERSSVATIKETRVVLAVAFLLSTAAMLGLFGPYRGYRGQPPAERAIVLYLLPTTALVIATLIASLQRRRLPAQDNGSADAAIQSIVFWVAVFLTGVHCMLISVLVGAEWVRPWAGRAVVLLLGVTLMSVGNLLPRTRPNMALGLRTARTIADRHLWMLTHRVGGYLAVVAGAVTVVSALFLSGQHIAAVPAITYLVAGLLIAICYWRWSRTASTVRQA